MAKVLITGINGFTGRYVAAQLRARGHDVSGLGVDNGEMAALGMYDCDLCDRKAIADVIVQVRPNVVVHLAGISFPAHGDVDAIYRINLMGTRNLIEAVFNFRGADASLLLASSANVYGNTDVKIIDESVPLSPANDYAVSKLAMEYVARMWMERLPITIVRPFNCIGLGQSPEFLLPKLVSHYVRNAPFVELGNLDVVRDFSDVRVVAQCYATLVDRRSDPAVKGQIFNACSGVGYSLQNILAMLHEISGHSPEVRVNPAFVRASEIKTLVGSRQKLERAIGPVNDVPLLETLRWMYDDGKAKIT
jgi:nucleoside-diphosphate-sugar epimerase